MFPPSSGTKNKQSKKIGVKMVAREAGGNMFFRNVGRLLTDYVALYPRRQNCSYRPLWRCKIPQLCVVDETEGLQLAQLVAKFWVRFSVRMTVMRAAYIPRHYSHTVQTSQDCLFLIYHSVSSLHSRPYRLWSWERWWIYYRKTRIRIGKLLRLC
jgi:hypothetical protein